MSNRIVDIKVSVNSPYFSSLRSPGLLARQAYCIIWQKVYLKLNSAFLKAIPFSSLIFGYVTQIQAFIHCNFSILVLQYTACSTGKDCFLNRKKKISIHYKFIHDFKIFILRTQFFHFFVLFSLYIIGSNICVCVNTHTLTHIYKNVCIICKDLGSELPYS